ncbi:hypothetical protein FIV37_25210 [Pseudomonas gessardii]|nr:hypothetical protein [Pseudomonas gessardii]
MWESGLPAMQSPRSARHSEVMPSQASQLPHKARSHIWSGVHKQNSRRIVLCVSSLHWAVTPCSAVVNP